MLPIPIRWLLPATLLSILPGIAATAPGGPDGVAAARPDPLDASAAVPPVIHRSAFTQYRHLAPAKLDAWKAANDKVGRIGGWRSYAREAAQNPAPAPPASDPGGHTGHGDRR